MSAQEKKEDETEAETFLTKEETVKVEIKNGIANGNYSGPDTEQQSGGRCGWCSWKKCGIFSAVIVVLFLIVCGVGYWRMRSKYFGTAEALRKEDILERLPTQLSRIPGKDLINGNFILRNHNNNDKLLTAMGTPGFVIPFIRSYNDIYIFKGPSSKNKWSWYSDSSSGKHTFEFEMGKEFLVPWGKSKKGVYHKVCQFDHSHPIISCEYDEMEKNWKFKETLTFFDSGMIQEIDFVTSNVQAVRSFDRISNQDLEDITSQKHSPFSDDSDDELSDDEDWPSDF